MPMTTAALKQQIAEAIESITDERVRAHIRSLLIEPTPILRAWEYGKPGEQYVCWDMLRHEPSNTGIAYCEEGFGPKHPWGIVGLAEDRGMGMDSGWFGTFIEAYFDSFAPTDLPIWQIFKTDRETKRIAISTEQEWDKAWEQIKELRASDPESSYAVGHSIAILYK